MIRDYPGRVQTRQVFGAGGLAVAAVAAIVALSNWLVLPPEAVVGLAAPAEPDDAQPGALSCPDPSTLAPPDSPTRVTASLLIDCPDVFHGRAVTYEGEVVESVLHRGGHAFVQLNDDPYADVGGPIPETRTQLGGNSGITVILDGDTADVIATLGSYRARGDVLVVRGTFHHAHPTAGGAPAIAAATAALARPGGPIRHTVPPRRLVVAVVAALVAATLAVGNRLGWRRRP